MNKGMIMLAVSGVIIVTCAGAAGAILAINSGDDTNTVSQNIKSTNQQSQEKAKLNSWKEESGSWYFYKNNEKQKNWVQDKNSWYYLGSDGKMRTGWIKDNGNWYYLNTDGTMATNTTVDNCYLNDKGIIEEAPTNTKASINTNTSSNISKSKYVVTSFEQAKNIVLKEDSQYIKKLNSEMAKNNAYIQLDNYKLQTINDVASSWNIPNEECYSICIDNYQNGQLDTDSGLYLVGRETGNIYIIPHQGCFPAYQIKSNQVVRKFKWSKPDAVPSEWR